MRRLSWVDHVCDAVGVGLATCSRALPGSRPRPGAHHPEADLAPAVRRRTGRLIRVNASGEVAAQALYLGQAAACEAPADQRMLWQAAWEEASHAQWCAERLEELGTRPSVLDPVWFAASWWMGYSMGCLGRSVNLGFLEETERQVVAHLQDHISRLSPQDKRSYAVLSTMCHEEAQHAHHAKLQGAGALPMGVRRAMAVAAWGIRYGSYWV